MPANLENPAVATGLEKVSFHSNSKEMCVYYTFDCVDHNKVWKILKEMGIQTTWPASWEISMQVRKQQLELDMEQRTGSK